MSVVPTSDNHKNSYPWRVVEIGRHEFIKDEELLDCGDGESYNCPNGCGECKPVERQFFTYMQFSPSGKLVDGYYHKIWSPSCCPETESGLDIWIDSASDTKSAIAA